MEGYSKHCEIEAIESQQLAPVVEFIAKSTIAQVSEMCVAYMTEKLGESYIQKYGVHMEGKDRESLTILAKRKCAEYLLETSKYIQRDY